MAPIPEAPIEAMVTSYLCQTTLLWLEIDDRPGPESLRAVIERNAMALLSNYARPATDPASCDWIGHRSNRDRVRRAGLWNQRHVEETHDHGFLDLFEELVTNGGRLPSLSPSP